MLSSVAQRALGVCLIGFASFVPDAADAETLVSTKTFLKEALGGSGKLSKKSVELSKPERAAARKRLGFMPAAAYTFYLARNADGAIVRGALIVAQRGKEGPMRVGVVLESDGSIERVVILSFEEERGKPVADKSFLKQYSGKGPGSTLRVGEDIDAVTGATVSSKAVTEAVRRAIALWTTLVTRREQ